MAVLMTSQHSGVVRTKRSKAAHSCLGFELSLDLGVKDACALALFHKGGDLHHSAPSCEEPLVGCPREETAVLSSSLRLRDEGDLLPTRCVEHLDPPIVAPSYESASPAHPCDRSLAAMNETVSPKEVAAVHHKPPVGTSRTHTAALLRRRGTIIRAESNTQSWKRAVLKYPRLRSIGNDGYHGDSAVCSAVGAIPGFIVDADALDGWCLARNDSRGCPPDVNAEDTAHLCAHQRDAGAKHSAGDLISRAHCLSKCTWCTDRLKI
mmetsp:Transcript_48604/g.128890  ORF Transcript_48604/g.128890 Transcript_48604/m.128890 type:complete len:265 (+) Transcript_48604:1442-2236(+)